MGFLMMAGVAAGIFFALRASLGALASALIAILVFLAWARFNLYAAFRGLAKLCTQAYFLARNKGLSHEQALQWVVNSRYSFEPTKALEIWERFARETPLQDQQQSLKELILRIHVAEAGPIRTMAHMEKLDRAIEIAYRANAPPPDSADAGASNTPANPARPHGRRMSIHEAAVRLLPGLTQGWQKAQDVLQSVTSAPVDQKTALEHFYIGVFGVEVGVFLGMPTKDTLRSRLLGEFYVHADAMFEKAEDPRALARLMRGRIDAYTQMTKGLPSAEWLPVLGELFAKHCNTNNAWVKMSGPKMFAEAMMTSRQLIESNEIE